VKDNASLWKEGRGVNKREQMDTVIRYGVSKIETGPGSIPRFFFI
jgi:hypothetical protein